MTRDPSALITIDSQDALSDLMAWAVDHAKLDATRHWLAWVGRHPVLNAAPRSLAVPAEIVDDVEALVNDWDEVLAAHGEGAGVRFQRAYMPPPEAPPLPQEDDRSDMLRNFVVLYGLTALGVLGFQCDAETPDHAEEQCRDAYPGCDVLWVWTGPKGVGVKPALDEFFNSGLHFHVERQVGASWDPWTEDDGSPQRFDTYEEAQQAIDEHLKESLLAVKARLLASADTREELRVVPVR